jgi:hypothetical protein
VVTVLIGVLVVAGTALLVHQRGAEPPSITASPAGKAQTPLGELNHATLDLSIFPQASASQPGPEIPSGGASIAAASQGWPFYSPSTTLELPAHSLITITIHQYDTGGQIYNPWLAKVSGTVNGRATVAGKEVTEIDPNNVAHTFTIHQYPETTQPYLFVSVPVPAQSDKAPNEANGYPKPIDVTFSFITGDPGQYVWNCEFPCGNGYVEFGGPMSQRGFMSGKISVV